MAKLFLCVTAVLSLLAPSAHAQHPVVHFTDARRTSDATPTLQYERALSALVQNSCQRSTGRLAFQVFSGWLGAWGGGLAGWTLLDDPEGSDRKVKGDAGYTPNANTAFAVGSWLGSVTGAYLAGAKRSECGSYKRSLGFTLLPSLPLFLGREEPYLPLLGALLVAPLQAIVATATYTRKR